MWRICCIISYCTSPISVLHEIPISVVCAPGALFSFHSHFNWELTANVTAGPWKGKKMKSGSNKEVAILQGHRRKRDLFEGLAGNFPYYVPETMSSAREPRLQHRLNRWSVGARRRCNDVSKGNCYREIKRHRLNRY